jgi:ATP-dependent DNA helicase RecQ
LRLHRYRDAVNGPIRAYCEWKGIAYRTGEQGQGGLSSVKTREGYRAIAALRRRPARMVRTRALSRWLTGLTAAEPENPWLADLRDCAIELESSVGGAQVPRADAIDWLYESAGAHARQAPGHLNLLTAHGAKGREFAHVLVLDAGDWPTNQPDERTEGSGVRGEGSGERKKPRRSGVFWFGSPPARG